jgi:hypothetical protein
VSDQWSADPGAFPPTPSTVPTGWQTQPGHLAPDGPPPFGSGPTPPKPAPPPAPKPPRTTRNLVVALSVLAVLLLIVSASLVLVVRNDDGELASGSPTTTAPSTTRPSTPPSSSGGPSTSTPPSTVNPTPAGPAPTKEELDAEIEELSRFVERERGLPFLEPVTVTMADEALFDERLFSDFDEPEQVEGRQETARILKALGLIDADLDLDETLRQMLSGGVLGFYDPETSELVVRGQAITPYIRETLVHELTHALDDQHFELHQPGYDDLDDETSFGFSAVVEGNARRIESAYVRSMSPEDQARRDLEEQAFGTATAPLLASVPVVLLEILQAPYEEGQTLVDSLFDLGGQELVDAAIQEPPTTSTQVLHPETFLAGIGALPVDPPMADGEVLDEGQFGELMTRITLGASEDPSVATNAASGWAGDWYVTWEDGDDSVCIRIDYAMDSDRDLDELEDAYTSWAAPRGATVERLGDILEVTSCSAAAGGTSPL